MTIRFEPADSERRATRRLRVGTTMDPLLMHHFSSLICALALAGAAAAATAAGWPLAHQNAANNPVTDVASQSLAPGTSPAWSSNDLKLYDKAPVTVGSACVYAPGKIEDGISTPSVVYALNGLTGQVVWQSAQLDPAIYDTYSAVTVLDDGVVYPSGQTVYKLDAETGAQIWSTRIDGTNTATSPTVQSWTFINSSVTPGAGKLFVETYGGMTPAYKQIVALDAADGHVAWFANDGGMGNSAPAFLAGAPNRVYTTGRRSLRCYNADTGARLWDSALDTPTTWTTGSWDIYSSPAIADGRVYVTSYDFSASTTTLVCADAATGSKIWKADAPVSDAPPLIMDGRVYVYGGGSPGRLAAYDAATGSPVFNVIISPTAYIYRDYAIASRDRIYVTDDTSLFAINPADGTVTGKIDGSFTGPASIDRLGGLYAHEATWGGPSRLSAFGETVPVELGRFTIE